jgi:hypothetical protein
MIPKVYRMDFQASTGQMGGCWLAKRLKAKGKMGKKLKVESGKSKR